MRTTHGWLRLAAALLALCFARDAGAQRWTAVDAGTSHTCALDAQGRAFCWGINHHGELGTRTPPTCGHAHHPGQDPCYPSGSDTPLAVRGGVRFRTLSAGNNRSCGLDARGNAFCWGKDVGADSAGCTGRVVRSFAAVPWAAGTTFRDIRAADDGICGITADGAGRCWRRVWPKTGVWREEAMFPGERLAWVDRYADWMDVDHPTTCAAAEDGRALCQGENDFAQLGAGDTVPRAGPVAVAGGARYAWVHPRALTACGLTVEGEARCWGAAESRERWPEGAPSRPDFFACRYSAWCSAPRPVAAGLRFRSLTSARDRFCGLATSGEVHCWGVDGAARRVPARMRFQALDGSETHACALAAGGDIWCWGEDFGKDDAEPVRVPAPPSSEREGL